MSNPYWADCKKPGCTYKACLRLNSEYCYPHTLGIPPTDNKAKSFVETLLENAEPTKFPEFVTTGTIRTKI